MERRVSVNDSDPSWEPFPESDRLDASAGDEWADGAPQPPEFVETAPGASYGPCLYLGRSGERCSNPAIAGGYCAKHHPDTDKRWPSRSYRRVLLASIALIVILWPYLQDAVQLVLRLVREWHTN